MKRGVVYYRLLAINTTRIQFFFITYIIKMKRANPRKGFALIEKMISQQFQGSDIYIFIASIHDQRDARYVGDTQTIGTGQIHVVTITDHKVGSFSDISLEHKIFSHGRICFLQR